MAGFQWKGVNGREKRKPLLLAVEKLVKCTEAVRQRENKKPNAEEKALMISNITVIENTIREGGNREYIDVEGTEDDLSRARSKAMYNAALARKSQRGVWKVGQAHVEDMNEERWNLAGEIELTSRNDFNDEYKRAIRGEVVEEKEEEEKKVEERERKEQEDRINMLKEMEEEEKKLKERKMKTRSNSETEMEERKEEVNEKEGASEKKSVKEERGEEEVRGKNKFRFEKYRRAGMKL